MLIQFILKEVVALLKKFGITTYIILGFLYFISIVTLNANHLLKAAIGDLARQSEFEVVFKPEVGIDEIQFFISQLQSYPWVSELLIRKPEDLVQIQAAAPQSELLDLLKELSPTLNIKSHSINQEQVTEFLSHSQKSPIIDEVIHNSDGRNILISLTQMLNKTSVTLTILICLIACVLSILVTHLMTSSKRQDILVLKSLGASPLMMASPMILFLMILQPLAFFSSYLVYLILSSHLWNLISQVEWLNSLFSSSEPLSLSEIFFLWLSSLALFLLIGSLKILNLIKTNRYFTIFIFLLLVSPKIYSKQEFPFHFNNLIYKKKSIENELELIEGHLQKIQSKINFLTYENNLIRRTLIELSHEFRKSNLKLAHVWRSESSSLSELKYQAKTTSYLISLIRRYNKQLKSNNQSLLTYRSELKKRQFRLKKLHLSLAKLLNLKENEYETYLQQINQQISQLKAAFKRYQFFTDQNKLNRTLVSPTFGKIVLSQKDKNLGHVLIIEESPHTHIILSHLETTDLKAGDTLEPGDIMAKNNVLEPKLQVRIFNQIISNTKLQSEGT
jgi:cell division protein FtsX